MTNSFISESVKRKVEGAVDMVAFFNQKLDINRFFVEDSEGNLAKKASSGNAGSTEMPGIEFGGGSGNTGFADNSDPFEDALEDALCVFKSGDTNSDILEKNEKLIMFYVDLENELIVDKKGEESKEQNEDGEMGAESKHPVLLN